MATFRAGAGPSDPTVGPSVAAGMATLPSMHPLIETHRAELLALARARGFTGVRVFGSMSRDDGGDQTRESSDLDLLVTLAPGTSALALGGLLLDAQELLGRRVDVVTEAALHPATARQRNGKCRAVVNPGPEADRVLLAHMRDCLGRDC